MWALRRVSVPLRSHCFGMGISHACCAKLETPTACNGDEAGVFDSPLIRFLCLKKNYRYQTDNVSLRFNVGSRELSSQADAKSIGEEGDLEDGFSELETTAAGGIQDSHIDGEKNDVNSEAELSDDDFGDTAQNELEESETDPTKKSSPRKRVESALFKAIMNAPSFSVYTALDQWVKEGKDLSQAEILQAMLNLRKRQMYGQALQLSGWIEANKKHDFVERDYASRLDLIAKVSGIQKAEQYIQQIPKSFRGEVVYRTLLANFVLKNNVKKAEELFYKMKDLEFPITSFACEQLLLLYKRLDKKKIADILLLMEKENVKPSLFGYKILIDTKGMSNDIIGMDQIVETMKADGFEPNLWIQAALAKYYTLGGHTEKAEALLMEMEGGNLKENRRACSFLLPLYAVLGKADEVGRIWNLCKSNPKLEECMAAIEAWGRLEKIEEAEAVFDRTLKTWKRLSSKFYISLLHVYVNHKMLTKGKDLVKRMADSGCQIGPVTWDALVKLYVDVGEVEKADSLLQKATQQSQMKPLYNSYLTIMDQYAKRGDVHNSEKIFHKMRLAGYTARLRHFQALIQAYINAKVPAYGMRDRMKADNIFPNKALANQLAQVDAFRNTAVSELFD
ncbi:Pentatricopeptide repeat-containing protein, mitochondrial [Quillaja saponaria]|uniref:Pentatricopeptide repeat-containing protein, mitochondrial n=1 Tax=Quillaja saponaria TaxID=32244 RepID=A0AAD7PZL5_QUISA|nr:Pentatricopeptide repeat-containing protein, mitochondrial [Quillaja saponaria]